MAFGREQSFITLILIVLSHRRYPYSFSIGGFGHACVYDFGSTGEPYWRRARMVLNRNRWPASGSLDGPGKRKTVVANQTFAKVSAV